MSGDSCDWPAADLPPGVFFEFEQRRELIEHASRVRPGPLPQAHFEWQRAKRDIDRDPGDVGFER